MIRHSITVKPLETDLSLRSQISLSIPHSGLGDRGQCHIHCSLWHSVKLPAQAWLSTSSHRFWGSGLPMASLLQEVSVFYTGCGCVKTTCGPGFSSFYRYPEPKQDRVCVWYPLRSFRAFCKGYKVPGMFCNRKLCYRGHTDDLMSCSSLDLVQNIS